MRISTTQFEQRLQERIDAARQQLLAHPVYGLVDSIPRLRLFMEHHVFAVWDFMSLLKALQRCLTCVEVPWCPTRHPAARLVNEIVLGEETDEDGRGGFASHYELYLEAMTDCGADIAPVENFVRQLQAGSSLTSAMSDPAIPEASRRFMMSTFAVIERGHPAEIAAAFTFGREDVIPDMFQRFVDRLCETLPERFERFRFYLERHIHLDADDHGPKALKMVAALCGDHPDDWSRAEAAAIVAIEARIAFWDAVQERLLSCRDDLLLASS